MSNRTKVKIRRTYRKVNRVLTELGKGASYAINRG